MKRHGGPRVVTRRAAMRPVGLCVLIVDVPRGARWTEDVAGEGLDLRADLLGIDESRRRRDAKRAVNRLPQWLAHCAALELHPAIVDVEFPETPDVREATSDGVRDETEEQESD